MSHAADNESTAPRNRLADSKSPYLLQHADNPVNWYPWGPEAFAKAEAEDKPIFLSIGYATCHWCHVMEHESFENPLVAALLNETFINIKVDREERPDIDQVYMTVCQMMTGSGGWPLTILMTPDKQPFYAATYIPRESRYGRIGMLDLIPRIESVWQNDRDTIHGTTERVLAALENTENLPPAGTLETKAIDGAFRQLGDRYDSVNGGFGSAPKFPSPHNLIFLTRYWRSTGNRLALDMTTHTLERMRHGGMYDQIGFGFHRYSTDPTWLVPHFEKMLYDQATLVMAYTEGWRATGDPRFERTVREILTYVERDMTSPEGAFYSAEDADSEGEEGLFYLWTLDEVAATVGEEDAVLAAAAWNLTAEGNYADEASGERTGGNIPHLARTSAATATALSMELAAYETRMEAIRDRLFRERVKRIHPLKDDKVLADWNGLMAAAMAAAGRVFEEPEWIAAAQQATSFVLGKMRDSKGRLLHRYRGGDASIPAFLDDYVFLTTAVLEIFDATLDPHYLAEAVVLQEQVDDLFGDEDNGGYFFSAADNERLLVRQKEVYDGAIPSGNSMAADNLVRLARLTGRPAYDEAADRLFATFASQVNAQPSAHSQMVSAFQRRTGGSIEVVIVGDPAAADTRALVDAARSPYLPNAAILVVPTGEAGAEIRKLAPFVRSYETVEGQAAAYVCRDFKCKLPTTDPAELERTLREATAKETDPRG